MEAPNGYRTSEELDEMTLQDLFKEADTIGNKYQTPEEIREFEKKIQRLKEEIDQLSQ